MPVMKRDSNGTVATAILPQEARRMILSAIKKNDRTAPEKVVLYGPEGWGKTTWGSKAPAAVFLSAEDGLKSVLVDVFPEPHTWAEVFDVVEALRTEDHEYKSLVIDSADWIESLDQQHVIKDSGKKSIVEVAGGFGKGLIIAAEELRRFLFVLDHLRREKGMNIIFLAHSAVKTFNNPLGDNFERWELKLDARFSSILKEWADSLLFGTYDVAVDKEKGQKGKGYGGERIIRTMHSAAYDAKNRTNLRDPMPVDADQFWTVVKGGAQ